MGGFLHPAQADDSGLTAVGARDFFSAQDGGWALVRYRNGKAAARAVQRRVREYESPLGGGEFGQSIYVHDDLVYVVGIDLNTTMRLLPEREGRQLAKCVSGFQLKALS